MAVVTDRRLPLGRETGHQHRRAAAQIGRVEHRAVKSFHAPDFGTLTAKLNIRAQPPQPR